MTVELVAVNLNLTILLEPVPQLGCPWTVVDSDYHFLVIFKNSNPRTPDWRRRGNKNMYTTTAAFGPHQLSFSCTAYTPGGTNELTRRTSQRLIETRRARHEVFHVLPTKTFTEGVYGRRGGGTGKWTREGVSFVCVCRNMLASKYTCHQKQAIILQRAQQMSPTP